MKSVCETHFNHCIHGILMEEGIEIVLESEFVENKHKTVFSGMTEMLVI